MDHKGAPPRPQPSSWGVLTMNKKLQWDRFYLEWRRVGDNL